VLPALSCAGARVAHHAPFPLPAHRTGHADLPHPALGQGPILSPTRAGDGMKASPRRAARAECENNLTILKTRGGVAHFFHNGPSACHNNMAFLALWRQTIVKMASGFFHNGPAAWRLCSNRPSPRCATYPLREKSGTRVALATQPIAGSRVNVMDHCATFFGDLARGSVALGADQLICGSHGAARAFSAPLYFALDRSRGQ
jgi:hypothetical protein